MKQLERCKATSLSSQGKKDDMLHRLRILETPELSPVSEYIDAVISKEVELLGAETMIQESRERLQEALTHDPIELNEHMGMSFLSNQQGEDHGEAKAERSKILQEVEGLKISRDADRKVIDEIQNRISMLEQSVTDAKIIRIRFLLTYKRDILKRPLSHEERDVIRERNVVAHDGNISLDATIYDGPGRRKDRFIFQHLYGVDPGAVKDISEWKRLPVAFIYGELMTDSLPIYADAPQQPRHNCILTYKYYD